MIAARCVLPVVCWSLLDVRRSLFWVVCCVMFYDCCSWCVICCLMLCGVCCVRCPLLQAGGCLLYVNRRGCLLFAV